jgi:hypothetical protein
MSLRSLPFTRALLAAGALAFSSTAAPLAAQAPDSTLWVARAMRHAYDAGTRSRTGAPGPRYWQNRARYAIDLTVAPPSRRVTGREEVTYVNASPHALDTLVFKLLLNVHKPGAPRMFATSEDYLTSGVHVDAFAVNGEAVPFGAAGDQFTSVPVRLPRTLAAGDSVRLTIAWHYDLATLSNREGMLDSTSAFIAYFYPRVAVFDDVWGWDTMDFNDRQEFYSDFNDYDVTIHAPANYVVWGTGTLTNAGALLQPGVRQRYERSLTADSTIRIATPADFAARRVTGAGEMLAWHFTARNIPDVTFALSDHFAWDGGSVVVDPATGRRASVQAAYPAGLPDFPHMVRWGRDALAFFSREWPGVPYPYEKTTIVQGLADMEYPMMVNDESFADTSDSRLTAQHEIAHSWFPFFMGINETRWAFMDEGWATTMEHFVGLRDFGAERNDSAYVAMRVRPWATSRNPGEDVPIITPSDVTSLVAYAHNSYGKASLGYLALRDLLGAATFDRAMRAYMDRWHGKHPQPWDFFNSINDATGQNLDWFWHDWFFTQGYIDYAVKAVAPTPGGYLVTIRNVGGMYAPFDLVLRYADGTVRRVHQTPALWRQGGREAVLRVETTKPIATVDVEGGIFLDANAGDNHWAAR